MTQPVRNTLPLVQIAAMCEHILQEKDEVLSAIRIVDIVTIDATQIGPAEGSHPAGVPIPPTIHLVPTLNYAFALSLKSGDLTGAHRLAILMREPLEGRTVEIMGERVVTLNGDDGVNVKAEIQLPILAPAGRYWIEVMWNGHELTRTPLIVRRTGLAATPPAAAAR